MRRSKGAVWAWAHLSALRASPTFACSNARPSMWVALRISSVRLKASLSPPSQSPTLARRGDDLLSEVAVGRSCLLGEADETGRQLGDQKHLIQGCPCSSSVARVG